MAALPATLLLTLLILTNAQSNPTAVVPSTVVPVLIPTGTFAASVITAAPDGNQWTMALQCNDDACANDPPATAALSLDSAGTGSYTFAWTARDNTLNSTSYACPLTSDINAKLHCTVAFPSGLTASAPLYSQYPMSNFLGTFPNGILEPVQVTSGIEMLPFSSLACGQTSCNANQVITPGGDGNAPTSGSGGGDGNAPTMGSGSASASATPTGSMTGASGSRMSSSGAASSAGSSVMTGSASGTASATASSTAQATGGAERLVGGVGAAMAAAAFVGAVAL